MAIQNLDNINSVNNSTLFAVNQNGLDYNCTGATVADFIQQNVVFPDNSVIQYAAPTTGSTVVIPDTSESVWLVLTPLAMIAALTIKLPLATTCIGNQEVLIVTTQTVTALTINLNGGIGSGIPSTLLAGSALRLRFEPVLKTWYNVTVNGPTVLNATVAFAGLTISSNDYTVFPVTVTGASLGDFVDVSFSDAQNICIFQGYVSSANTVTVMIINSSLASRTLPSGTIKVRVTK